LTPNRQVAALVGNGLSMAANADLGLASINAELRARLNQQVHGGDAPATLLSELARATDPGDSYADFESLLGPLDQLKLQMNMLFRYSRIVGPKDVTASDHLAGAAQFIQNLSRTGTGHALEIIAQRSVAAWGRTQPVDDFIRALVDACDGQRLVIGNLNYDSLVMASLTNLYQPRFCDLADGRTNCEEELLPGTPLPCQRLRTTSCFPVDRQIRLVHLHGSLAWWRSPAGVDYRFHIDDIRALHAFREWRQQETQWTPSVVLTNQPTKTKIVQLPPFALAYEVFRKALVQADRWIIAGYSFRDACVNAMLAEAWAKRGWERRPEILVVTYGNDLPEETVLDAIGWSSSSAPASAFPSIDRNGIQAAPREMAWAMWNAKPRAASA
jgi:hypothetical protein